MATEQQIMEGIRRADAAGDSASVQALGRELQRVRQQSKPKETSFLQGVVEGIRPAASNAAWLMNKYNPANQLVDLVTGGKLSQAIEMGDKQTKAKLDRSKYRGSTAGQITGGIIGSIPTMGIPGGPLLQGGLSGLLLSEDRKPTTLAKNATIGAVTGKIGQQVGKRVVAPVAERVGRTKVAQAAGNAVRQGVTKVTGRTPQALPVPAFTATDRTLNRVGPDLSDVQVNLADAQRLNLPYSLADASPELRQLAGSVSRKSPEARALAENTFGPRALGQADRAISGIDDMLAPITNIEQRAGDIRTAAQTASKPFYDQARSMPAPVDEELTAMLRTTAGQSALKKAYTIASNEGRDPQALGMFTDDTGTVWMGDTPTFETLQLVKRGLDTELAPFRNPITGKLDLEGNPEAGSIAGLVQRFNQRLSDLNEPYRQGNQAYARQIGRRDALELGQDVAANNVPQRQFDAALSRMDDVTRPEMERGYATSMADTVNRQRYSSNPYNAVYGSPLQQGKVAAMFPQGADDFGRLYSLEGDMAKTATETLGGSPTAARLNADQLFDSQTANIADMGLNVLASPKLGLLRLGAQKMGDHLRTGGEKKAAAIAPDLFNMNPQAAAKLLEDLMTRNAQMQARVQAYRNAGSLVGVPAAAGSVGIFGGQ